MDSVKRFYMEVEFYGIDKALILIENREKRRKHGGVS